MGMFDEVICEYPLPGTPPDFVTKETRFQTKDLDCDMTTYRIGADGHLYGGLGSYTGKISFYMSNSCGCSHGYSFTADGEDFEDVEYTAEFYEGTLTSLVESLRQRKPALPVAETRHFCEPDCGEPPESWLGEWYTKPGFRDNPEKITIVYETDRQYAYLEGTGPNSLGVQHKLWPLFKTPEEALGYQEARKQAWNKIGERYKQLLEERN